MTIVLLDSWIRDSQDASGAQQLGSPRLLAGKDKFFSAAGQGPDYDWPNPRGPVYPVANLTHIDPLKLNLRGQDKFFSGAGVGPEYDYPNPRGPQYPPSLRVFSDPLKLNLLGKDKFFGAAGQVPPNTDWPVPKGPPPVVHYWWPTPNVLAGLLSVVPPKPFNLLDWPNPTLAMDRSGVAIRAWADTWQDFGPVRSVPPPGFYGWTNPPGRVFPADLRVFYPTAFLWQRLQPVPFDTPGDITDTDNLQLPVNVVMAGDVPIKAYYSQNDVRPMNIKYTTIMGRPKRS